MTDVVTFKAGDITPQEYQNMLDQSTMTIDPATGRPIATSTNLQNQLQLPDGFVVPPRAFEVPEIDSAGNVKTEIRPDRFEAHDMFLLGNTDPACMDSNWFVKPFVLYEMKFVVDLVQPPANYTSWYLVWQIHPSTFGPNWSVSGNPPISLVLFPGVGWQLSVRGSTQTLPTNYTSAVASPAVPAVQGQTEMTIRFRLDPFGNQSFTEWSVDGVVQFTTTAENFVNHSGLGAGNPNGLVTIGSYSGQTNPEVCYPCFSLRKE